MLQIFIALNLAAILFTSLPGTPVTRALGSSLGTYIDLLGLAGPWTMFAPDPPKVNVSIEAVITMKDGSQRRWSPPKMKELSYLRRYLSERYRKWAEDRVRQDAYQALWPNAAMFAARQVETDRRNPAVKVALVRTWTDIPRPNETKPDQQENRFKFYELISEDKGP